MARTPQTGQCEAFNLGAGVGYSVLELVAAFEQASGQRVPYQIQARRTGDLPSYHANAELAHQVLGWQATRSLHAMCADTWRWQSGNPQGYPPS